jgi:hypothetical protein
MINGVFAAAPAPAGAESLSGLRQISAEAAVEAWRNEGDPN